MEKTMWAFVFALLFLSGCLQKGEPAQNAPGGNATFVLPASGVSYHARYTVEEGGPMTKEVWRTPDKMRIDMLAQGIRALSLYFVGGQAYSCSFVSQLPACYDITSALSQGDAGRLVPSESDVAGATRVESVKIGSTTGSCYELKFGALGARKLCFAPQGVMAFDSYNVSKTISHIEYLTDIEYYGQGEGPADGVFALPATADAAPDTPALPMPGFEG